MNKFLLVLIAFLGGLQIAEEVAHAASIDQRQFIGVQFGEKNPVAARAIERINHLYSLRERGRYVELSSRLQADLNHYRNNAYARQRILNELADLYSNNLFDLERAIEFDQALLNEAIQSEDSAKDFRPIVKIANNNILANENYFQRYAGKSRDALTKEADERLARNLALLNGNPRTSPRVYTLDFLTIQLEKVRADIKNTTQHNEIWRTILSRYIRIEYELSRRNPGYRPEGGRFFLNGDLTSENIDFSEINFLQLGEYLISLYKSERKGRYAELALDSIYRPYVNIREPSLRWRYNKLINDYIAILIDGSYEAGNFDEMLYYISLNKSRMLLEERLAFGKDTESVTTKLADLIAVDGIPRTGASLPDKNWFKQRILTSGPYMDFYVGGKYGAGTSSSIKSEVTHARSVMPLNLRDFGVEDAATQAETFLDDSLYVSLIDNGRVVWARKLVGEQLANLKAQLNASYLLVSAGNQDEVNPVAWFRNLRTELGFPSKFIASPDKWLSKHPLDFHLDARITRSVNLFTATGDGRLSSLRVGGFFNPTLDLIGAEQEADALLVAFPSAQVFRREAAQLSALHSVTSLSVIHLAMHGAFNAGEPRDSKLYFAGARRGLSSNDTNALYVRDMSKYAALRDRDLIFAAACQTGLSAADQINENELMGILRPLTANRNKNIILSLWKVDDTATKDFVSVFYQRLASTKDVVESFHFAQDMIRARYKQPYYWAAFYLAQAR